MTYVNHPAKRLLIFVPAIIAITFLASCAPARVGYGVVLWSSNDSTLKNGQIVSVKSESKLNHSYTLAVKGTAASVQMPTWRVALFGSETDAVNFSLAFDPYVSLFGKATTNGAPIRQEADPASPRIYRMREGQLVKIISKDPTSSAVAGVTGYWYKVLTDDGATGYCFSANLNVFNPALKASKQESADSKLLDSVLSSTFRPQYYRQMIDSRRIDLSRFSVDYGFFVNRGDKSVRIVMPAYSLSFTYTDLKDLGNGDYLFEGTPVQMTVRSPEEIRLLYTDGKGVQYDQVFVKIQKDVGVIVAQETNRRLRLFGHFLDKEPFTSDYYGRIELGADMRFTWTGYNRLVPGIIPSGLGASGMVDFPLYLDSSLMGSYDGVVSFYFGVGGAPTNGGAGETGPAPVAAPSAGSTQPTGTRVSFLYSFSAAGLKLTYAPPATVDGDVVTRLSATPIVIFFSSNANSR